MEEWKEIRLIDLLETLIDYRGKTPRKTTKGIPLITAKIVKNGRIDKPNEFISVDDYSSWMVRGYPKVGDVVLTTEAPMGEVAQIEDANVALAQRIVTLRGKEGILDNTYLKYFLMSNKGQQKLKARETGTTVVGIKQAELREILVDCPPYNYQLKIASILKSLDDKIENNRKINENLEQQAQALFKSWFVDFEPFRDQPFVESELGMIPEGWRVGTLSEIAEYSKSRISIKDIDTQTYVSTENMLANKQGITEASGLPNVENVTRFEIGDVLISNIRPYFKKLHYCNHIGGCSGDVMCFHPLSKEYRGYLYCSLYDDVFFDYVMSGTKGTKMPRGDKRQIMNYRIIIPSNSIINQFNNYVLLLLSQIDNNRKQSRRLSLLRDTLLPKLMSGKIKL